MASCSCVAPLQRAMNMRKDLIEISASMFNGIFKHHHEIIVKQVICVIIVTQNRPLTFLLLLS